MRTNRPSASNRPSRRASARSPRAAVALDLMRPSDAFAVSPTSRLDDPARWLRPTLRVLALVSTLAAALLAATRAG